MKEAPPTSVHLYWVPLGAGDNTHCVRTNGLIFEWMRARLEHRSHCALYHSALTVRVDDVEFAIEMGPAWGNRVSKRGVVGEGPVGLPSLGRWKSFRYEVRCCRAGVIPDAADAVGGPVHLDTDLQRARKVLDLVPKFPTLTWGRDELKTGDMWNSNTLTSWLLAGSGHDVGAVMMPPHGRAPGWTAGLLAATRLATPITTRTAREAPQEAIATAVRK
jgi:hypothetical protein